MQSSRAMTVSTRSPAVCADSIGPRSRPAAHARASSQCDLFRDMVGLQSLSVRRSKRDTRRRTIGEMRYLVTARLNAGRGPALMHAIENGSLGRGSVAGDEYLRNMAAARELDDGRVQWVEVCYCPTPLQEEREYWEAYFTLVKVQDAHARSRCRDLNGTEPWACGGCDCSEKLESRLGPKRRPYVDVEPSLATSTSY